jgi:hypothetical protein
MPDEVSQNVTDLRISCFQFLLVHYICHMPLHIKFQDVEVWRSWWSILWRSTMREGMNGMRFHCMGKMGRRSIVLDLHFRKLEISVTYI